MSGALRVCLIGLGEVGQAAAVELARAGATQLAAWDLRFADPDSAPSHAAERLGVRAGASAIDAVEGAELVISAVTAAQCVTAAEDCAPGLGPDAFFLDLNSASPGAKHAASLAIEAAGARYVEAAVMSPIEPKRLASPMLLGGPHARAFLDAVADLGFDGARAYSPEIGKAAATKLCRSVMIKGFEALITESLLAARHYGVEADVLASLSNLMPMPDWPGRACYMISRSLEHGTRRAEEMREAAMTVDQAGVAPTMSAAIAARQDWAAGHRGALSDDLGAMLDAMLGEVGHG